MRAVLRRVSYVSLANVVNGVLGVVFVPVAVARLGTTGYGLFSIYLVLAGYTPLIDAGVGKNLIRLLGGETRDAGRREHLRSALAVYLSLGALFLVLTPGFAWLVPRVLFPVAAEFRVVVALIVAFAVAEYAVGIPVAMRQNHCLAQEHFGRYATFQVASGSLRYLMGFAAILLLPRSEVVVGFMAGRRVIDVFTSRLILGPLPSGSWRPRFVIAEMRRMVGHSAMLSVAQFVQISVVSAGSVLVNYRFGLAALGVYRAVLDLASRVWLFSNSAGSVVFPRFVHLWVREEGRRRLRTLLPAALQVSWLGYALLGVAGAVVGPLILPLIGLGGPDYGPMFATVVVGTCLMGHGNIAYEFVQATGRYGLAAGLAALSLTLMVGAFVALAPVSGLLAIGWAWFLSQTIFAFVVDGVAIGMLGEGAGLSPGMAGGRVVTVGVAAVAIAVVVNGGGPALVGLGMLLLAASVLHGRTAVQRFRTAAA